MRKLSDRINKMSESATLAMARLSRELKEQGKDVITLSLENQILLMFWICEKCSKKSSR